MILLPKLAKEIIDNGPYDLYDYEKLYHLEGDIENNPDNNEAIISSIYVNDIRNNNMFERDLFAGGFYSI